MKHQKERVTPYCRKTDILEILEEYMDEHIKESESSSKHLLVYLKQCSGMKLGRWIK